MTINGEDVDEDGDVDPGVALNDLRASPVDDRLQLSGRRGSARYDPPGKHHILTKSFVEC